MSLKTIQNSYDQVAETYDANYQKLRYRARSYWVERSLRAACLGKKVLELGCGTGRLADALRRSSEPNYIGIDVSEKMLEHARRKGHQVVLGNAENLPFTDESFEVVAAAKGVFRYLDKSIALKEVSRVLKKNGTLVVHQYAQETRKLRGRKSKINSTHLKSHRDYDMVAERYGLKKVKVEKWRSISFPPYVLPLSLIHI